MVIAVPVSQVITVSAAPTARSRCKECSCLLPIEQGAMKVSCAMFAQGRTIFGHFHANCFAKNGMTLEHVEKGGAGKCKVTQQKIEKGDFRMKVHAGNAKFNLSLGVAQKVLPDILAAAATYEKDLGVSKNLPGFPELPKEVKAKILGVKATKVKKQPGSSSSSSSSSSSLPVDKSKVNKEVKKD